MVLKDYSKEKLQEKIDYIMDSFDFHKVHKVMETLNWTWVSGPETNFRMEVPDEFELRRSARRLFNSLLTAFADADRGNVATGGFECSFRIYEDEKDENDMLGLRLAFVLEDIEE